MFAAALQQGGATVVLVSRHESGLSSFQLVRQGLFSGQKRVEIPITTALPEADITLISVRGEQLDGAAGEALWARLKERRAPVVMLSPVLKRGAEHWKARLPNVVLSLPAIAVRWHPERAQLCYWSSPLAITLLEMPRGEAAQALIRRLRDLLTQGGIKAKLSDTVESDGPATTVAFFPFQVALASNNHLRSWGQDPDLIRQLTAALRECRTFARRMGRVDPGVALMAWALSQTWLLRCFCAIVPRVLPDLTEFLEFHFGPKLMAQHRLFAHEIEHQAAAWGASAVHLRALVESAERSAASRPALPSS